MWSSRFCWLSKSRASLARRAHAFNSSSLNKTNVPKKGVAMRAVLLDTLSARLNFGQTRHAPKMPTVDTASACRPPVKRIRRKGVSWRELQRDLRIVRSKAKRTQESFHRSRAHAVLLDRPVFRAPVTLDHRTRPPVWIHSSKKFCFRNQRILPAPCVRRRCDTIGSLTTQRS